VFSCPGTGRILYAVGNVERNENQVVPTAQNAAEAGNKKRINNVNYDIE